MPVTTPASPVSLLFIGILLPLVFVGFAAHSAWQQIQASSPIPPITELSTIALSLLVGAFLVHGYFSQDKPEAMIVRFPVFFVSLLWTISLGITAESLAGAHRWQQHTAIAEQVTASRYGSSRRMRADTDTITYRYLVQGKTHTGRETLTEPNNLVNKPLSGNQRLRVDSILKGETFYIRVNPTHPERSFIQRRVRYLPFLFFLLTTFLLARWTMNRTLTEKNGWF